jgi:FHA domain
MGEMIWVEMLTRHREVAARYRFTGPEIRIGRGYSNDVVVDDPYVALEHLRIRRSDDRVLVAEDIGTLNGMYADSGAGRVERVVLDGDRVIRIGRTSLRIRGADYVLPRERALARPPRTVSVILVLAALLLGFDAVWLWLREVGEPRLSHYISAILAVPAYALSWAGVWAILCRIFSGQPRFERQLLIALGGMLAYTLYREFGDVAPFAISWYAPERYEFVARYSLLAVICFWHLREIGPSRLKLKGGIVAGLAFVAVTTQWVVEFEARADYGEEVHTQHLLPTAFRLMPFRDEDAFFGDVEKLKGQLDRDRKKQASVTDTAIVPDPQD